MTRLLVGVWAVGTQTPPWIERDITARCVELENALKATETLRGKKGDPNGLFVAPEYMFTLDEAKRHEDARFQMDAADARFLKTRLAELSNRFPRILLVPGSIAFSKSLDFNENGAIERAMKWHGQLSKHKVALASGAVSPHHLEEEAKAHKLKIGAFEKRAKEWVRTKGATKLTIARNSAYGYLDGKKVFACRKRTELAEIYDGNDAFYINAGESTVWKWDEVTFGVEICKDAADGYLSKVAKETVDVQIVISASLETDHIQACARKYIVHAAQQEAEAGVFTDTKGRVPPLKNTRTQIAGFNLDFFLVEVGGG